MYLPLETTFAIFVGGVFKLIVDNIQTKRGHNTGQRIRSDNVGVLIASGLIAGEALIGLVFAVFAAFDKFPTALFENPSYLIGLLVLGFVGWLLVRFPVKNAGNPEDPAPPAVA
jgi:hypothetical protein